MPITREDARRIAEEHMAGDPHRERRLVTEVATYQEILAVGTRPPKPYGVIAETC